MMGAKEPVLDRYLIGCSIRSRTGVRIRRLALNGSIRAEKIRVAGVHLICRSGPVKSARIVISAFGLLLLIGCDSNLRVEIADAESRQKYIEILKRQGFDFSVDDRGVIHVDAQHGELEKRMQEYKDWERARLKQQGVRLMDKND
jgi:hypothetical protein